MSTRSNICYVRSDYAVLAAYCHSDGNVKHQGPILLKHYNLSELAEELVLNGYMSGLAPTIEEINSQRKHKDKPELYKSLGEYLNKVSDDIEYFYVWGYGGGFANVPEWRVFMPRGGVNAPLAEVLKDQVVTRREGLEYYYTDSSSTFPYRIVPPYPHTSRKKHRRS